MSVYHTPSPSSATSSPLSIDIPQRKCVICLRPAYSNNYGVLTCDACKMFFRRIVILNKDYKCKYDGRCAHVAKSPMVKCKGCRYQQCLDAGMSYQPTFLELTNEKDLDISVTIGNLVFLDTRKSRIMKTQFTDDDFSLEQIVDTRRMKMKSRTTNKYISPQDWTFLALYTTVDLLLNLDFMEKLSTPDKLILLRHSASKCALLGGAMRTYLDKKDRMTTVDGQDIYPKEMRALLGFQQGDDQFLDRVRSLLISKLAELDVTTEECILISAIIFCDPAVFYDQDYPNAQQIVSAQQQNFTSALSQYCLLMYQRNGPSRLTNLLSLCPIIQKNFEDLQYLTMVFRLAVKGMKFKKIEQELI